MPKLSQYNHFQPWQDGYYIAYNATTGAVALMTSENYAGYQELTTKLDSATAPVLNEEEQTLLRQLQYGRFVIPDHIDENWELKFKHNLDRYDRSGLGLVIAPTLACNMNCGYCYEGNKKGRMSAEVVEAIVDFVEKQAPGLRTVDVSWYGGEPLLAMDIIEDLTETLLDMAEEYKFNYVSSMITNGYLLTPPIVDKLAESKVGVVQITLDGPARMHDRKRPLKNGQGSFHTIVNNLTYAVTRLAVTVRVNIDKSFHEADIVELLDELRRVGVHERVSVYFGQLEPATDVCSSISESCYETLHFSEAEVAYHRQLLERQFRIKKLPAPVSTFCMAQHLNTHLIDPEGNLYRCFNQVGDVSKSYGNIRNEIDFQHPNFTNLFNFDPFSDKACGECDLLPVCMGGCPSRRIEQDLSEGELCHSWKHNLRPMLEIIARSRQQQAAPAVKEQS